MRPGAGQVQERGSTGPRPLPATCDHAGAQLEVLCMGGDIDAFQGVRLYEGLCTR